MLSSLKTREQILLRFVTTFTDKKASLKPDAAQKQDLTKAVYLFI
jgi:hypothetical protein